MKKSLYVGAHMSIAGGHHEALYRGKEYEATAIQIFTANQRRWEGKPIAEEEINLWEKAKKQTGIQKILSHASYLINLGSFRKEILEKSRKALKEEIQRCHQLEIDFLVIHPGSYTGGSLEESLDIVADSLSAHKDLIENGKTKILLENTAGQGTNLGSKFEELAYLIKKVEFIGFCLDTCHLFAAGYDIRTEKNFSSVLNEFDKRIGFQYLHAFHINDSVFDLGSKRDRHASLGKGKIGLESFRFLMRSSDTKYLPKILETKEEKLWKNEIRLLKKFATS